MNILIRFALLIKKYCKLDREYRRDVLSLFEPNPDARLLDLGCGDGEFTSKVAQKIGTGNVFGIDVVKESVEQAKARGIDCYLADLEAKFPFEDESFDVVCANQIIEHLSNTDGFVREVHRLLKPGGYAVISTPNLAAWHCIASLLLGWQPYQADISDEFFWAGRLHSPREESMAGTMPHHRRLFTLRALTGLLDYRGFKSIQSEGTGFPPLPSLLARLACTIDKRHAFTITVKALKLPAEGLS